MVWMMAIQDPRMKTGLTDRRAVDQAKSFRQCGGATGGVVPVPSRRSIVLRSCDRTVEPAGESGSFGHGVYTLGRMVNR